MDALTLFLLSIFPLGQLPGVFAQSFLGLNFRAHLIDVIVFFTILFMLIVKRVSLQLRGLSLLLSVLLFGLLFSVFRDNYDLLGVFYLIRLLVYLAFFSLFLRYPLKKDVVLPSLIVIGITVALFGWVQYIMFPDLTSLKYAGWDDHFYRLVSTFLDPAFTGILLVLSSLSAVSYYLASKNKFYLPVVLFLLFSLGFTYSRASFVALFVGLFILLWRKHKTMLLVFGAAFAVLVVALPRSSGGEGVKLARVSSISQKLENYEQSFVLISDSPLFGIGYNNICRAKELAGIDTLKQENSCYGLDNSFLFIWATMGVLGLMGLLNFYIPIYRGADNGVYGQLFRASSGAVMFHALFTNTLFYPWVIVWMALLASISRVKGNS